MPLQAPQPTRGLASLSGLPSQFTSNAIPFRRPLREKGQLCLGAENKRSASTSVLLRKGKLASFRRVAHNIAVLTAHLLGSSKQRSAMHEVNTKRSDGNVRHDSCGMKVSLLNMCESRKACWRAHSPSVALPPSDTLKAQSGTTWRTLATRPESHGNDTAPRPQRMGD